jgi:F0F1-type ATP synthase assembly protein I
LIVPLFHAKRLTFMARQDDSDEQRALWVKYMGLFSVIVGDMIGCVGAGVGLGYLAMKLLHAPGWVLLPTTIAGFVVAMVRLYRIVQKQQD